MGGLREETFSGSGRGVENENEGRGEWRRVVERRRKTKMTASPGLEG